jgi:hypothetical protein
VTTCIDFLRRIFLVTISSGEETPARDAQRAERISPASGGTSLVASYRN